MKRITLLAAAGVLVATPVVGAWTAFAATDDSPPQTSNVRVHDRGDDRGRTGSEREPGDDHARDHRHGADDRAGHVRHGGESEPGDDRGGDDRGHRDRHHGGDDD